MKIDETDDYIFDEYFYNINLNEELKEFYDFLNDDQLTENYKEDTELVNLRNDNYKKYCSIDILKIKDLEDVYEDIVVQINKLYEIVSKSDLLNNAKEEAIENQKILDLICKYYEQLKTIVENDLKELELKNDKKQEKIKEINYCNLNKKVLEQISNKYNELVIFNSTIEDNIFDSYKRQLKRKKYIKEIFRLINVELTDNDIKYIDKLNKEINDEKINLEEKFIYLQDLMIANSIYEDDYNVFKNYVQNLLAYDDRNFTDVYRVYELIFKNLKIKSLFNYFEDLFIKEREDIINEEKFIYEKYGIKNIKTSLDYVSANYIEFITQEEKELVNYLYNKVEEKNFNLDEIYNRFSLLTNNIWKRSITDIYSYNLDSDFCFICTNNQFIDEKHESILITKKMLERVTDYSDYQIGFICNFNNNILYITENDDIMTVEYEDMSNLKTPKQLEQEFLNFKVCNRIALNGYLTKISAVYFIDDGDFTKYKKAVSLANQYNLPLIILKKDKN